MSPVDCEKLLKQMECDAMLAAEAQRFFRFSEGFARMLRHHAVVNNLSIRDLQLFSDTAAKYRRRFEAVLKSHGFV